MTEQLDIVNIDKDLVTHWLKKHKDFGIKAIKALHKDNQIRPPMLSVAGNLVNEPWKIVEI